LKSGELNQLVVIRGNRSLVQWELMRFGVPIPGPPAGT